MDTHMRLAAVLVLAVGLCLTTGCEDSDPLAIDTSTITLSANPGTVIIDIGDGEDSGQSTITAQLFDATGVPLDGFGVLFSTTGGLLRSATNACEPGGACSLSADACSTDADCPFTAPDLVTTDSNGLAFDVLTLRIGDGGTADTVTVTASSGTAPPGTIVIPLIVQDGSPTASISINPSSDAQTGEEIEFDGSGSFDLDGAITCYRWDFDGTLPSSSAWRQDTSPYVDDWAWPVATELDVTLWVSDINGVECDRQGVFGQTPPSVDTDVFRGVDSTSYLICDNPQGPIKGGDAPGDVTVTLTGSTVSVPLDAGTWTDDQAGTLTYSWDCDNGDTETGAAPDCVYDSVGNYDVTLTVTDAPALLTDQCRKSTDHEFDIDVVAP